MIFSATFGTEADAAIDSHVMKQIYWSVVGLVAMIGLMSVDYRIFSNLAKPLYFFAVTILLLVVFVGQYIFGAQRWVGIQGLASFQPSEVAKILVIVALARFFSVHREQIHEFQTVLKSLGIVGLPLILVLVQPDLGTAMVFGAIWVGVAFAAGVLWRHFMFLFAVAVPLIGIAWRFAPPYMIARLAIFMNPENDALGEGYNIIQATISVGSGGFSGRGFLSGTQSQLHFLRVQYADFIFSVLAEELGFIGAIGLIALFAVLTWRGIRSAFVASEPFGRLVSVGIVSMLMFQVFVNIGMNISLLPVTGIPLPFISYGGSSLITFMASVGLLESITMRHRKFEF